jgi:hypothetical protein
MCSPLQGYGMGKDSKGALGQIPSFSLPATIPVVWPEIIKRDELCNTIVRTADEALQSGDLPEDSVKALHGVRAQFLEAFERTASDLNVLIHPTIPRTIEMAFLTGILSGRAPLPDQIEKALKAQSTLPARDARSAKPIQAVIDEAARAYWKDHPKKRNKPSDTARAIAPTVRNFVKQNGVGLSENVRKNWESICSDDKRLLDAIRKRLPNVANSG